MTIKSANEYFLFFDDFFEKYNYPLINEYYEITKENFIKLIQDISTENAFATIKELVRIDAKLQILSSLIDDNIFKLSETEIIRLAEIDSGTYYEEIFRMDGMTNISKIHSLIFL